MNRTLVNKNNCAQTRGLWLSVFAAGLLSGTAHAAVPGISGTGTNGTFDFVAQEAFTSQPDGSSIYSWGYGCATGSTPSFKGIASGKCPTMQIPGPTMIVTEGDLVTVHLTNNLPAAAGNTSMLFPGFQVTSINGTAGLLTKEATATEQATTGNPPTHTVTYTFDTTGHPGTHAYYSGTQGDLQIEMGLYGAVIVLPKVSTAVASACDGGLHAKNIAAEIFNKETDFRLAHAAYNHPEACYDREYLFQFSEVDQAIHQQARDQILASQQPGVPACNNNAGCLSVVTENYHPQYFMINGRSLPDDLDPNYAIQYPHQPYNGNPHMHPGELTLLRVIGTGRWQHPFHEHGNHVRILARDGNILLSKANDPNLSTATTPVKALAGPLLFTTTTTPGQAMDGIFYWTGKGLNWDVYAHRTGIDLSCTPDADGYNTDDPKAANYFEWCQDHGKALEKNPLGEVPSGGPVTLPDANILTNGTWYGGSPYLGPDAGGRAAGPTPIPPAGTVGNDPGKEAGFAFMWHSHNEREITTGNAFPGGMMMMMLVDPRAYVIDESK